MLQYDQQDHDENKVDYLVYYHFRLEYLLKRNKRFFLMGHMVKYLKGFYVDIMFQKKIIRQIFILNFQNIINPFMIF